MEEDSKTDNNILPFPHQTSTSQHQRLVSSKSSGRGKLNIVDYGHDEAAPQRQPDANNAITESAIDKVDRLDKFLPPPSQDQCSEELQRRIDTFLYLKRSGKSYNAEVCNKKDYRNPDFLLHAVQYQDIDQIGSCFGKDVFDPHGYDKTDYMQKS
ncbi:SAP30-binding protein-like [Hibiscus syriacus]|uniref:SAP30-binding protein-like n=1 Tax=Hibiscus syriacus TaxID=106335 RepID=UPI001924EC0A|nr:SAP30-binding protein-like [Hibiscus syriacus]